MHEAIMNIRHHANKMLMIADEIEIGVLNGHTCPVCGGGVKVLGDETKHYEAVDCVVVPLEVPKSCDKCFIAGGCISAVCCGSDSCKKLWNKVIDHHKK